MSVCALDHIVLDVANVEQSLHFYQSALGLGAERVEAWRRGEVGFPSLRINEATIIDLVSDSGAPASTNASSRTNLAHFCLVTDSASLDQAIQTLAAAGVAVETGPVTRSGARGNALSIYFRDPDQNLIELRTYAGQP